ncbi:iron(III) transport system ATP-binding protein [Arthrobacter ginsengisoli]|uniref:Iron(III) transport system ATP-binding protein n=1 Tax=Arthrobacter ginsengisoli TaxID=1356565 RepID=A0ABU1UDH9_9MICC|nr:ABC transporter ATP-binding protein [Arthrobacter ginsengisoli]MDR7083262.1 iron(III) transport system ATP-binding protein [Arthrobacter ginsengisoli]
MNTNTLKKEDAVATDLAAQQPLLAIRDLRKQFTRANGHLVTAVDDITLSIAPGEFIVLLGPSGCGKTTLLRCIGGLETASEGTITINGRAMFSAELGTDVPTRRRGISMVFQSYALWPNMTVFENIAFPLKSRRRGMSKSEIREAVEEITRVVGISDLHTQYPHHISGGQQQRVALARALVDGNALVLFDEPLSNVDAKVRRDLRIELAALQAKLGFAAVYVTHDQEDAMELADRIVVLEGGRIAQVGAPQEIYENPVSSYVAGFVGSSNSMSGTVREVTSTEVVLDSTMGLIKARPNPGLVAGQEVEVMFRPQHVRIHQERPSSTNAWPMLLRKIMHSGTHAEILLTHEHEIYQARADADFEAVLDSDVWVTVEQRHVFGFPKRAVPA